mmetsp:Transcript_37790/g.91930  ORF Transcript_37790/g.91930 Transcript_37790/m.91930 type:complete len:96 (+) Transcript_37790:1459-1746(+)
MLLFTRRCRDIIVFIANQSINQSINLCRVSFIRPVALFLSLLSDPFVLWKSLWRQRKFEVERKDGAGINQSTQKKSGISSGCNVGGSCRETMADS